MSDDENTSSGLSFDTPVLMIQCGVGPIWTKYVWGREDEPQEAVVVMQLKIFCSEECMLAGKHVR